MKYNWFAIIVTAFVLLPSAFEEVHSQPLYADTLLFPDGSMIIGDVMNFPPEGDSVIVQYRDSTCKYALDDLAAIHTELEKRNLTSPHRPSPYLATLGSLIFPGVGQFINGNKGQGAMHLILALGSAIGTLGGFGTSISNYGSSSGVTVGAISFGIFVLNYLYSLIDAPLTAIAIGNRMDKLYPEQPLQTVPQHSFLFNENFTPQTTCVTIQLPF